METVTSRDGTRIAFERSGDGPPLILVDAAFCHRANGPARALAAELAPPFTVYAYDRRGRGASTDTPPYVPEREVEDLQALIERAGGAAFVYGLSSGAVLALEAAARGLPIDRLALYEPSIAPGGSDRRAAEAEAAKLTELATTSHAGDAAAFFLASTGVPAEAVEEMRAGPGWPAMVAVERTLAYDVTIVGAWSTPAARAAEIAVPTLVLNGGASFDWMGTTADELAAALPAAQRRTLEGQPHFPDPAVLAPVLAAFFAG